MTADPLNALQSNRSRILAVDDDRVMRAVISRVLTAADMDVVAVNVDDALRLLENSEFDLVICDRSMPGVSGQEFLEVVRSDHRFDFTPFLFLTVSEDIDDIVDGLRSGADDYITKPFHPTELVARVTNRLDRAQKVRQRDHELVDLETFAFSVERELTRAKRGRSFGVLAVVNIPSLQAVESSLGDLERRRVLESIATVMNAATEPLDMIGATRFGDLAILLPEASVREAADQLREMATLAASMVTQAKGLNIRPVPMIGFAEFDGKEAETSAEIFARASQAAIEAEGTQDLQPRRWIEADRDDDEAKTDHHPARDMLQVWSTVGLGIVLPFFIYLGLYKIGIDVSWVVYIAVVLALVSTAALIWMEGLFAGRHPGAPEVAGAPEPPASAIICAYMPNEAGTIVETIEHFLQVDYPAGLQVILAYNTPEYLPVEAELQTIAARHPNLLLLKVENSNSKAQNLNAALARATGDFIGVFDADHQPDADSYHRAWRWLSNGYDVVQGHCLVRNPEETFLAKMVAVEFETIYAVAHPGRWIRDGFGIFGGSNGYWRTEALHMTRMRGSMLTEDIDASMRVLEAGGHIASDPGLISRELATTTAKQIWNQRLRWAQGWTQVSLRHFWRMLRLPHFKFRQKFGVVMLLLQREIYPWISGQIFPLLAFWWVRGDAVDWFVPVFVAATIFTTSVGPGMSYMAYRLAHPSIKRKSWFWQYGIFSTLLYTEAKNVIARVGHVKELMGESSWRVTPRSADPASAALPSSIGASLFDHETVGAAESDTSETTASSPLIPASTKVPSGHANLIDMLAHTRRTTGSCLWCGETRAIAVERCSRCGHGWIDQTLDEARMGQVIELPDLPGGDDASPPSRRRRWAAYGLAAALVALLGATALYLSTGGTTPSSSTVIAGSNIDPVLVDASTTSAAAVTTPVAAPTTLPVTVPVPTTGPAPTTQPAPTTLPPPITSPSTTTTTTSLPPLPSGDALPADTLTLGAFAFGPLNFGIGGEAVAERLVATFGQPTARLAGDASWGLCPGADGRILQWDGFSAIFRQDGAGETFVGYRYDGSADAMRTISGLQVGMTLDEAQALYPSSIITTTKLEDGSAIYLLQRSSDRRTLLWGPIDDGAQLVVAGIYSYRSCDRGPFER